MLAEYGDAQDVATNTRAREFLERAIALDGRLPEPHFQLGKMALDLERPVEAARRLETAARLSPRSSKIHFVLARAYRRMGRMDDAAREIELFERAKEEEDRTPPLASRGEAPALPEVTAEKEKP
jgi:tetratricopeptide (TPR) repeat protein